MCGQGSLASIGVDVNLYTQTMQFQGLFLAIIALFLLSFVKAQGGGNDGECEGDELDCLRQNIPGEPKQDYPIYGASILCKLNPKNPGCPGWGK